MNYQLTKTGSSDRKSTSIACLRFCFLLLLVAIVGTSAQAQERDSIPTQRLDSIGANTQGATPIETYAARYDPRKALLYSAVFPGGGQMYNNAYWKLPIIYGGFVGFGLSVRYYQQANILYKDLLYDLLNEPNPVIIINKETGETSNGNRVVNGKLVAGRTNLGIETLRQRVDRTQRNRDYSLMLTIVWYVLQVVEAHVDAHLKEFKVNPQLNVSVEPEIKNSYATGLTSGVSLRLKF